MTIKRVTAVATDGVEGIEIDGTHVRKFRIQDTDPYYEENKRYRDNIDKSAVTRGWALPVANIPFADYQELVKRNPELVSTDAKVKTAAWMKTLKLIENERLRTVRRNLIPDNPEPDSGSIILPYKEPK